MSNYKITIEFEVKDDFSIHEAIAKEGLEVVQHEIAQGFLDPEFKNLTCTIKKV